MDRVLLLAVHRLCELFILPQVSVHTEEQGQPLEETAPLGTEQEPGVSLPALMAQPKCESPEPEAPLEEPGRADRAVWGEGEDGPARASRPP